MVDPSGFFRAYLNPVFLESLSISEETIAM
jgi:hypothetical protein